MKRFSLALAALFLSSHAWAVEPAGSPTLPFPNARVPAAAKNADEAPRWTSGPATGSPAPNFTSAVPNSFAPNASMPVVGAGNVDRANAAAATGPVSDPFESSQPNDANALAQRPLQSVMKRRQPATAAVNTTPAAQPTPAAVPAQAISPMNVTLGAPVAETNPEGRANPFRSPTTAATNATSNVPASAAMTPNEYGVVQASGNVPSNASSEIVPGRYEQPLQLGLPPTTESNVEKTIESNPVAVESTASAPLLFAAPANATPIPIPNTTVETPPQTNAVQSSTAVQASATQALPENSATNDTTVDPQKVAATRAAADLLATSAVSPPEPFYGANTSAISLAAAIASVGEQNRTAAVAAYWRLSVAVRGYHWAVDELKRLEQVVTRRGSFETSMLSTARAAAEARIEEAKIQVIRSQAALENLMGQNGQPLAYFDPKTQSTQKRPAATYLASDSPLVGPYRSYFEVLFVNRPAPTRAREVDRILPLRWETINDRTIAVHSASSAVHYAEEAHAKGDADIRIVLACHEELQKQRRAFLNAVLDYNIDVADYAVAVAAPGTTNEKLVSMLIYTKQPDRVTSLPGRPAVGGTSSGTTFASPPATSAATSPAARGSDGWVTSSMSSLHPLAPRTAPPARTNGPNSNTNVNPVQNSPDPFRAPATGNRYGGRYGDQ